MDGSQSPAAGDQDNTQSAQDLQFHLLALFEESHDFDS